MALNMTQCTEAAETVRGAFYLVPSLLNSFSAIGTFFVFWLIYMHFSLRIYYHINAKVSWIEGRVAGTTRDEWKPFLEIVRA